MAFRLITIKPWTMAVCLIKKYIIIIYTSIKIESIELILNFLDQFTLCASENYIIYNWKTIIKTIFCQTNFPNTFFVFCNILNFILVLSYIESPIPQFKIRKKIMHMAQSHCVFHQKNHRKKKNVIESKNNSLPISWLERALNHSRFFT